MDEILIELYKKKEEQEQRETIRKKKEEQEQRDCRVAGGVCGEVESSSSDEEIDSIRQEMQNLGGVKF